MIHPRAAEIDALLRAGHSNMHIVRELHLSAKAVAARRADLGLRPHFAHRTDPFCRHGHPWPQHLRFDSRGGQYCAACQTEQRTARRRAAGPRPLDEAAVARAVAGDPPTGLPPREREVAVLTLTARGASTTAIAERVRCTTRTVSRIRARRRARAEVAA